MSAAPDPPLTDEATSALRGARERFISGFGSRHDQLAALAVALSRGEAADVAGGVETVHRMAGLAGTLGFPGVGDEARELEHQLRAVAERGETAGDLTGLVTALGEAFATDLAAPAPVWATAPADRSGARILVVEDDDEQRGLLLALLRSSGYDAAGEAGGANVLEEAKRQRPDLILLDIDLPGVDGLEVCRRLKAEPTCAGVPVIFLTARVDRAHRMAGLTLGADDYLTKPFDPAEVLLRLERALARRAARAPAPGAPQAVVSLETLLTSAGEALSREVVTVGFVRTPPLRAAAVAAALAEDVRRRDLVAQYGDSHVVLAFPEVSAPAVQQRLSAMVERLAAEGFSGLVAGLASAAPGGSTIEQLLDQADQALAAARVSGARVGLDSSAPTGEGSAAAAGATQPTILVADDDPDVLHIIEPRLRAAGYHTEVALDGQQAMDLLATRGADLVILDLTMPKLTGFEVLSKLRGLDGPHPHVVVLSGRGREDDVTRAFGLGADDYVTKPFSPEELLARVGRLLR